MDIESLQDMAAWARERVVSGEEPPWTFEKLNQLNQICAELAASMQSTSASFPVQDMPIQMENRPEAVPMMGVVAPAKGKIVALDRFRSRRDALPSLPLPM